MLDSLVRVLRWVEWKARQPTPQVRRCTQPAIRVHASFLDHHSGKPTGSNPPALVMMQQPVLVCTSIERRTDLSRSTSDRDASTASIRFPPGNFRHSLTLFSKSFSSFPRGTCSLSVSRPYLALDRIYHPIRAAFPNNPTRRQRLVMRQGPGQIGRASCRERV